MVFKKAFIAGVCAVFLVAGVAAAQTVSSTAGAINGTVVDSTKAVLPGVSVTLSGDAVMGSPADVTSEGGSFRFAAVPPGEYKLTFELAGFGTVIREGIRVSVGFTATVNIEMNPATVAESVTVSGQSPVVDMTATNVATHFDAEQLERLPGSRDFWAVVAQAPAVSMTRMDVGGSGALTQQAYTSYGLASNGGVNRGVIEGMVVNEGGGGGGSDLYYTDYGSFAEIAVNAVGNTAEMPNPGVLSQFITKSGGNTYHGNVYFDYENDSMEARNIDAEQIARGVAGSGVLAAEDTNRLSELKDFNVDLGGFVIKDRLWWYGAFRRTVADQRYPTLIDDIQHTWSPVGTAKVTYNLNASQKLIGYYQHSNKEQPDYLGAILIGGGRTTTAIMTKDSVWHSVYPVDVWKLEYNKVLSDAMFFEVLGGRYQSVWTRSGKSMAPRIEDTGNNFVSGGVWGTSLDRRRPQARGSLSYTKSRWAGDHNFKFGGELMRETLTQPFGGMPHPSNSVSRFNNGAPSEVRIYQSPSRSENGMWTTGVYANDTWQVTNRMTVNLGIRFDRFRGFRPDQEGPDDATFAEADSPVVWKNWGPRLGISYDLTGNGKTVVKANFGQFWLGPAADFTADINPNAPMWYRQYAWSDVNGSGVWDPGEEGRLISAVGGSTSTAFDESLKNSFTRQVTAYLERELLPNFGVRTGFVWNGRRDFYAQINQSRPLSAYNVPVPVTDPGPDGRTGTADDASLTAYNLASEFLAVAPVNVVTQLEQADSDFYTWEMSAIKRDTGRWSMMASFAHTWSRDRAIGTTTGYTPNALINTDDGRNRSTSWQGKLNATLNVGWNLFVTPIFRYQSGTNFGRTFVATLNYGTATILAEPFDAERTPNIALFDVRTEKGFSFGPTRLSGFFDVYNIFNTNAEQAVATQTGSTFLRPVAITPPRIARVGVKFQW